MKEQLLRAARVLGFVSRLMTSGVANAFENEIFEIEIMQLSLAAERTWRLIEETRK